MYIHDVVPTVGFWTKPPYEGQPKLQASARLVCPSCKNSEMVTTNERTLCVRNEKMDHSFHRAIKEFTLEIRAEFVHGIMAQLKKQRACQQCGVVSIAPDQHAEPIRRSLLEGFTVEWILDALKKLEQRTAERQLTLDQRDRRIAREVALSRERLASVTL